MYTTIYKTRNNQYYRLKASKSLLEKIADLEANLYNQIVEFINIKEIISLSLINRRLNKIIKDKIEIAKNRGYPRQNRPEVFRISKKESYNVFIKYMSEEDPNIFEFEQEIFNVNGKINRENMPDSEFLSKTMVKGDLMTYSCRYEPSFIFNGFKFRRLEYKNRFILSDEFEVVKK